MNSNTTLASGQLTGSQIIGTFDEDIFLTIFQCSSSDCSTNCSPPTCTKHYYIPRPDCEDPASLLTEAVDYKSNSSEVVTIYPNPFQNNQFIFTCDTENGVVEIFSSRGSNLLSKEVLKGDNQIFFEGSPGIYYLKFTSSNGSQLFKIVKL